MGYVQYIEEHLPQNLYKYYKKGGYARISNYTWIKTEKLAKQKIWTY